MSLHDEVKATNDRVMAYLADCFPGTPREGLADLVISMLAARKHARQHHWTFELLRYPDRIEGYVFKNGKPIGKGVRYDNGRLEALQTMLTAQEQSEVHFMHACLYVLTQDGASFTVRGLDNEPMWEVARLGDDPDSFRFSPIREKGGKR